MDVNERQSDIALYFIYTQTPESFVNVGKVSETFASLEKSGSCDHGYSTKNTKQTNKQTMVEKKKQTTISYYISFYRPPFDSHLLLDFLLLLSSGPFCLLLQCHKLGKGKEGEVESLETIGCKSLCISGRRMMMMMVLLCDHL